MLSDARAASSSQHLRAAPISMTSAFERENMFLAEMKVTAKEIARRGCGILATDESHATVGKRLATVGVENTPRTAAASASCCTRRKGSASTCRA